MTESITAGIDVMVERVVLNVLTGAQSSPSQKAKLVAAQLRMLGLSPVAAEWAPTADGHDAAAGRQMRYVGAYVNVVSGRDPSLYDGSPVCPVCLSGWAKAGQVRPDGLIYTAAETSMRYFGNDHGYLCDDCAKRTGCAA